MNILAFVTPIVVFLYFLILGYAMLYCLWSRKNILQNLLLAPAIGITVTLIPVFWINRYGYPIKTFAIPLTAFLFLSALITLLITSPKIPVKKYLPFLCIFLFALILTGRPLLIFGFDWLSYANEDMANYCLGALRFFQHGYSDIPNLGSLIADKDLSQYYWFTFVPAMVRSGCELLIAWLSCITHLNPARIFMPLILAFYMSLVSASGALVLSCKKYRFVALVTCLLVACSALTALGVLYELIAQVLGVSLLIVVSLLFFQGIYLKKHLLQAALLLSLTLSALLITYPEVSTIFGSALFLYLIVAILKGWKPTKNFFLLTFYTFLFGIIILNTYWINVTVFLQLQITQGLTESKGTLFPYFLLPSGIANLWGMQTLAMLSNEPWLSISIFLSFLLNIFLITLLIKQVPRRFPAAIIVSVFLFLSLLLVLKLKLHSGFSLFKIAMYIQPFLFAVLAIGLFNFKSYKKIILILITLFLISNLYNQHNYVLYSYGDIGTPFNELPSASKTHLLSELEQLQNATSVNSILLSDTASIISSKLQALDFTNKSIQFFSQRYFDHLLFTGFKLFRQFNHEAYVDSEALVNSIRNSKQQVVFNLIPSQSNSFITTKNYEGKYKPLVVMEGKIRSVFNRRQYPTLKNNNYIIRSLEEVKNHLIFINSRLGQYYYYGESPNIALYNLEKDYFYPDESMAAIGRYLLFRIINPEKRVRLSLTMTTTLNHDGDNRLPQSKLIGDKYYTLPFIGRGSARIFSSIFNPQIIQNCHYIMLDMQTNNTSFHSTRTGLMKLYGTDISLDTRLLSGYVRDISLIDDLDYIHIQAPNYLSDFPKDLRDPNLEYSGIYEDGWLSEDAFLILNQPKDKPQLTIKGSITNLPSNTLSISVDNKHLKTQPIAKGFFTLRFKIPTNAKHKIQLHFSQFHSLSAGDPRPVAAKIEFIGFT